MNVGIRSSLNQEAAPQVPLLGLFIRAIKIHPHTPAGCFPVPLPTKARGPGAASWVNYIYAAGNVK
jgi:hypothetical protein